MSSEAVDWQRLIGFRGEGTELSQVVQTRVFLADVSTWEEVGRAHGEVFGEIRPVTTMTGAQLLDPAFLVEIDALAWVGD